MSGYIAWLGFSGPAIFAAALVCGQAYPSKPIRIVTAGVGGGSDFVARLIAQGVSAPLGQQVVVVNYPSGPIQAQTVSKAAPDGYTLLVTGNTFMISPLLQKLPYDPIRDFSPITLVSKEPSVIVVHPSLPVKSVKDLVGLAKARPGELNYASVASGSSSHLAAELFNSSTNIKIQRVPYTGVGQLLNGLIGGEVHLTFASASSVAPHLKSGRLRAVAVTSAGPSTLVPGLSTVAETVPGYEDVGMTIVLAPAKTPEPVINRLNQEIVMFLKTSQAKERFLSAGADVVGGSPEELGAAMDSEIAKKRKVIKDANIVVN